MLGMVALWTVSGGGPLAAADNTPYDGDPIAVNAGQAYNAGTATPIPNAGAGGEERTYTVQPGDWLCKIARQLLGDADRWRELVDLNKDKYPSLEKNPNLIYAGWVLRLPGGADSSAPSSSTSVAAGGEEGTVCVNGSTLNVRTGPWGKIIGSLNDGAKVKVIGTSGDWYKIDFNGQTAYVHANYVSTARRPAGQVGVREPSNPGTPVTVGSGRFGAAPCSPMPGRTSSEYGPRDLFGHSYHYGIDLPVSNGTRLNALGDGVVVAAGYESGGGNYVKVRYDNGVESFMCHLRSYSVRTGQRVNMGQEIARSDNTGQWTTGAHLHLGIKVNGKYVNPRSVPGLPLPPR